jgi:uncharacterized protein YqeY
MFKLKEVIKAKDKKYINALIIPYGVVLDKEFDNNKDELSQFEMNEINNELKQRWLK